MEFLVYILLITATIAHAVWNYILKKEKGGQFLIGLSMVLIAVGMTPIILIGYRKILFSITGKQYGLIFISVILHLLYFYFLNMSYRYGDLSTVYPLTRTLAPVLTLVLAIFILSETLSGTQWKLIVFIILGTLLMSKPDKKKDANGLERLKGIVFAILCAISIALYSLIDKYIIYKLALSPLIYYYALMLGMAVAFVIAGIFSNIQVKDLAVKHLKSAIKIALLSPVSYLLILLSMQYLDLTVVSVIRQLSIVFSYLLGAVLLGESTSRKKNAGLICSILGVLLLGML